MNDDQVRDDVRDDLGDGAAPSVGRGPLSRRGLLLGGGAGALALLAAACGDDDDEGGDDAASGDGPGDLDAAKVAASLEVLAINTYQAALDGATAGSLGAVPPAVASFATTALAHHTAHLESWNGVLTAADEDAVTEPPEALATSINERFATVTDVAGVAALALELEQTAAATYLLVVPALTDKAAITLAAQMHAVDMQHIAVLLFVAGQYPVPDTFAQKDKAFVP